MHSGIINLDKPRGITSREAVTQVARKLGERKAGHAGTLDPAATGVLIVCVGGSTRLASYFMELPKTYDAVVKLGENTETQDGEGRVVETFDTTSVLAESIKGALQGFVGEVEQIPPMYSALKRDGVPLYKLARQGKTAERTPRRVTIYAIEIQDISVPFVRFTVRCSRGTYIRTLCEDLGRRLGTGGHLSSLRRTAVGGFQVRDACSPEEVSPGVLIPPGRALSFFRAVSVSGSREATLLLNGNRLPVQCFEGAEDIPLGEKVRLIHPDRGFVGVGKRDEGEIRVEMLMGAPSSGGS